MNSIIAALVLSTAMLSMIVIILGSPSGTVNAVNITKKSSSNNCNGDQCYTITCINDNCQTSVSPSNSTRSILDLTNP